MSDHSNSKLPNRRQLLQIGAAASAAGSAPFLFNIASAQSTPIKIGFLVPLTGAYSTEAQDQVRAAELAIKEFNASMAAKPSCWCVTTSSTPAKPPPARWS